MIWKILHLIDANRGLHSSTETAMLFAVERMQYVQPSLQNILIPVPARLSDKKSKKVHQSPPTEQDPGIYINLLLCWSASHSISLLQTATKWDTHDGTKRLCTVAGFPILVISIQLPSEHKSKNMTEYCHVCTHLQIPCQWKSSRGLPLFGGKNVIHKWYLRCKFYWHCMCMRYKARLHGAYSLRVLAVLLRAILMKQSPAHTDILGVHIYIYMVYNAFL